MTIILKPEKKEVLEKIDFVNKYRNLYNKHSDYNDRLRNYDIETVKEILKNFGYNGVRYYKSENFFKVDEASKADTCKISFNISFDIGLCEFIWDGMPWRRYLSLLNADLSTIKKPAFHSYDELRDILSVAFEMYEDYKRELYK